MGGGAVSAFAENLAAELVRVLRSDDVFARGRKQNVGFEEHGFLAIDVFGFGEIENRAGFLAVFHQAGDVEALRVINGAVVFDDRDDFKAGAGHELGGHAAYVAESLNNYASGGALHAEETKSLLGDDHAAAARSLRAAAGAAEIDGLSGDDGGLGVAGVHGIGVHDPGHGLLVGVDVGSRDVDLGTDELEQLGGVAAGDFFELGRRQDARIADDASLGSAEGNVGDSAFPGHPGGEGADFIESYVRSVPDSAFCRTPRDGVLDAKAREQFDAAVVKLDGNVDDDLAGGRAENLLHPLIDAKARGRFVKARLRGDQGIEFVLRSGLKWRRFHE